MPWFSTVRDWVLVTPQLNRIEKEIRHMAGELEALQAQMAEFVRENGEVAASIAAAIAKIQALLERIQVSGISPEAVAAVAAEIQAEVAKLDAAQQAIQAAADTPVPPAAA